MLWLSKKCEECNNKFIQLAYFRILIDVMAFISVKSTIRNKIHPFIDKNIKDE